MARHKLHVVLTNVHCVCVCAQRYSYKIISATYGAWLNVTVLKFSYDQH